MYQESPHLHSTKMATIASEQEFLSHSTAYVKEIVGAHLHDYLFTGYSDGDSLNYSELLEVLDKADDLIVLTHGTEYSEASPRWDLHQVRFSIKAAASGVAPFEQALKVMNESQGAHYYSRRESLIDKFSNIEDPTAKLLGKTSEVLRQAKSTIQAEVSLKEIPQGRVHPVDTPTTTLPTSTPAPSQPSLGEYREGKGSTRQLLGSITGTNQCFDKTPFIGLYSSVFTDEGYVRIPELLSSRANQEWKVTETITSRSGDGDITLVLKVPITEGAIRLPTLPQHRINSVCIGGKDVYGVVTYDDLLGATLTPSEPVSGSGIYYTLSFAPEIFVSIMEEVRKAAAEIETAPFGKTVWDAACLEALQQKPPQQHGTILKDWMQTRLSGLPYYIHEDIAELYVESKLGAAAFAGIFGGTCEVTSAYGLSLLQHDRDSTYLSAEGFSLNVDEEDSALAMVSAIGHRLVTRITPEGSIESIETTATLHSEAPVECSDDLYETARDYVNLEHRSYEERELARCRLAEALHRPGDCTLDKDFSSQVVSKIIEADMAAVIEAYHTNDTSGVRRSLLLLLAHTQEASSRYDVNPLEQLHEFFKDCKQIPTLHREIARCYLLESSSDEPFAEIAVLLPDADFLISALAEDPSLLEQVVSRFGAYHLFLGLLQVQSRRNSAITINHLESSLSLLAQLSDITCCDSRVTLEDSELRQLGLDIARLSRRIESLTEPDSKMRDRFLECVLETCRYHDVEHFFHALTIANFNYFYSDTPAIEALKFGANRYPEEFKYYTPIACESKLIVAGGDYPLNSLLDATTALLDYASHFDTHTIDIIRNEIATHLLAAFSLEDIPVNLFCESKFCQFILLFDSSQKRGIMKLESRLAELEVMVELLEEKRDYWTKPDGEWSKFEAGALQAARQKWITHANLSYLQLVFIANHELLPSADSHLIVPAISLLNDSSEVLSDLTRDWHTRSPETFAEFQAEIASWLDRFIVNGHAAYAGIMSAVLGQRPEDEVATDTVLYAMHALYKQDSHEQAVESAAQLSELLCHLSEKYDSSVGKLPDAHLALAIVDALGEEFPAPDLPHADPRLVIAVFLAHAAVIAEDPGSKKFHDRRAFPFMTQFRAGFNSQLFGNKSDLNRDNAVAAMSLLLDSPQVDVHLLYHTIFQAIEAATTTQLKYTSTQLEPKLPRLSSTGDIRQIRKYRPGDSIRSINWKATARYQEPMTVEYEEPMHPEQAARPPQHFMLDFDLINDYLDNDKDLVRIFAPLSRMLESGKEVQLHLLSATAPKTLTITHLKQQAHQIVSAIVEMRMLSLSRSAVHEQLKLKRRVPDLELSKDLLRFCEGAVLAVAREKVEQAVRIAQIAKHYPTMRVELLQLD